MMQRRFAVFVAALAMGPAFTPPSIVADLPIGAGLSVLEVAAQTDSALRHDLEHRLVRRLRYGRQQDRASRRQRRKNISHDFVPRRLV